MKKNRAMLLGVLGATIGIIALQFITNVSGVELVAASFGATFVLIFALPDSAVVKPRNIIVGYLISTSIALLVFEFIGNDPFSLGLAFGLSFVLMQITKTLHPPAGSIPLLILFLPPDWKFVLTPILVGVILILVYSKFYNFILIKFKP
ncbi:MAG: HPP family protein [Candidatus Nanopelagicales bacterium]